MSYFNLEKNINLTLFFNPIIMRGYCTLLAGLRPWLQTHFTKCLGEAPLHSRLTKALMRKYRAFRSTLTQHASFGF